MRHESQRHSSNVQRSGGRILLHVPGACQCRFRTQHRGPKTPSKHCSKNALHSSRAPAIPAPQRCHCLRLTAPALTFRGVASPYVYDWLSDPFPTTAATFAPPALGLLALNVLDGGGVLAGGGEPTGPARAERESRLA